MSTRGPTTPSMTPRPIKVLVVDDDPVLLKMVQTFLTSSDDPYEVLLANSGQQALELARTHIPDLVLLDLMMPEMDGIEVCVRLRQSRSTYLIPVIMLTASALQDHRLEALRTGVDDYLSKPFDPEELEIRIQGLIRRIRLSRASNPLTGLPGNLAIEHELNQRLAHGERLACCYLDIDNFKAFNDYYSFEKGDECIRLVADVLIETVEESGLASDFLGHIGGDDFILVTEADRMEALLDIIIAKFDQRVRLLYNDKDREQGWIEVLNRQRESTRYPIATLSIGVSTNERRELRNALEVSEIATELKRAAKIRCPDTSNYIIDRRSS